MHTASILAAGLLCARAVSAGPCKPPASPSTASTTPAPACTAAAVRNPSFAAGLAAWDSAAWSTNPASYSVASGTGTACGPDALGRAPDACAVLFSVARNGNIGQAAVSQAGIPVVDGASYTLSFRYRISQPGSGILGAIVDGRTSAAGIAAVSNTWLTYAQPVVAAGDEMSIAPFQRTYGGAMQVEVTDVKLEFCSAAGTARATSTSGPS